MELALTWDRVAVWAGRGVSQAVLEAIQDGIGDRVGDAVSLDVGAYPIKTQDFGEPDLQDAVAADDLGRCALAFLGEDNDVVGSAFNVAIPYQPLESLCHAGGTYP